VPSGVAPISENVGRNCRSWLKVSLQLGLRRRSGVELCIFTCKDGAVHVAQWLDFLELKPRRGIEGYTSAGTPFLNAWSAFSKLGLTDGDWQVSSIYRASLLPHCYLFVRSANVRQRFLGNVFSLDDLLAVLREFDILLDSEGLKDMHHKT